MSSQQPAAEVPAPQLLQVLSFWDLVVYGLCYVAPIGPWSTFGFAYDLSGGLVVLVFVVGAAALSFTACSYAQMCTEVPGAGSVYAYARYSMGDAVGFLAGWMVLLDYLLIPALMYAFSAVLLAVFLPDVPKWVWVILIAAYNLGVNWFGIKTSARFNFGTLLVQFAAVAVVLATVLVVLHRTGMPQFTVDGWWKPGASFHGVFAGASLCVMSYLGFDAISTLSAEVKPEQRNLIGRAIIFSIVLLGALAVVNVWTLSDLSHGFQFQDPATATYDLLAARVSPAFSHGLTWVVTFIVAASITPPMVTAVSRVLYAMALDGEMPRFLASLHPKYGVPHMAILTSGALSVAVALAFVDQVDTLTSFVNIGALSAFMAVNASVIALYVVKRKSKQLFVHLFLPLLGVVTIAAVITQMSPLSLELGVSWLTLGALVYFGRRQRAKLHVNATSS